MMKVWNSLCNASTAASISLLLLSRYYTNIIRPYWLSLCFCGFDHCHFPFPMYDFVVLFVSFWAVVISEHSLLPLFFGKRYQLMCNVRGDFGLICHEVFHVFLTSYHWLNRGNVFSVESIWNEQEKLQDHKTSFGIIRYKGEWGNRSYFDAFFMHGWFCWIGTKFYQAELQPPEFYWKWTRFYQCQSGFTFSPVK
jgi:hypothetical protein